MIRHNFVQWYFHFITTKLRMLPIIINFYIFFHFISRNNVCFPSICIRINDVWNCFASLNIPYNNYVHSLLPLYILFRKCHHRWTDIICSILMNSHGNCFFVTAILSSHILYRCARPVLGYRELTFECLIAFFRI